MLLAVRGYLCINNSDLMSFIPTVLVFDKPLAVTTVVFFLISVLPACFLHYVSATGSPAAFTIVMTL